MIQGDPAAAHSGKEQGRPIGRPLASYFIARLPDKSCYIVAGRECGRLVSPIR